MNPRFGPLFLMRRFLISQNLGRTSLLGLAVFWFPTLVLVASGCHRDVPEISTISDPFETSDEDEFTTQWRKNSSFTIAPGIHVLAELFPSAAYAIETKRGTVLVDTGADESGRLVREILLSFGLEANGISTILLTHAHYDHVFGANKLRQMSGATVMAGRDDCETLRRVDFPALYSVFPHVPYSGDPIQIDRELVDGERIDLGDVQIEVIATPGHTPGSTCYLLEKDSKRYLISGDVIASLNFGPATYPTRLSPKFRGDAKAYLGTINRLLEMEPPDFLLPGHPQQQSRTESIELDASTWRRLLESARVELETLTERYQRDGADFLDQNAKSIEPKLYYLGDLGKIAVYCVDDGKRLIVVNAPGDKRFSEFLSRQLSSMNLDDTLPKLVLLTSNSLESRSGLQSLDGDFQVIAAPKLVETLRGEGFDVAEASGIVGMTELNIEATELAVGLSYSYRIGERTVLFTPNAPRNIAMTWADRQTGRKTYSGLNPHVGELTKELSASAELTDAYSKSLLQLREFSPDVWLPVMPLVDQNANLYDDAWVEHLDANRRGIDRVQANMNR